MLELPEVITVSNQLHRAVTGKKVVRVLPPAKPHKFCWFNGDPKEYERKLAGSTVTGVQGFGLFVEVAFDNGERLCFNDGVNARLLPLSEAPGGYQLLFVFEDGEALVFTVAMYGGIILHDGNYDNEYYRKSKTAVSFFSEEFAPYYRAVLRESKQNLSVKAFLATEQRFPGLGNGVLQDILLAAGIHPKQKIGALTDAQREELLYCIPAVLRDMTERGGRDTERDLYGKCGRYATKLSRNTLSTGCPQCGNAIVKEPYLGGAIYYCPVCQPMKKEQ